MGRAPQVSEREVGVSPVKAERVRQSDGFSRARQMAPQAGGRTSTVNNTILAAAIIVALYVGKAVFLPIAAAILLAFVLSPIVRMLRRIRIPRLAAALLVVSVTFSGLLVLAGVLSEQVRFLATELPRYESTLREKVRDIRGVALSNPAMERAAETLKDLQSELAPPEAKQGEAVKAPELSRIAPGSLTARSAKQQQDRVDKPVAVELHYPAATPLDNLLALAAPLVEPIAMLAIVLVLVPFIIVQNEELRDRFIRLSGSGDMQRTTAAMTDAAQRLSRFLLTMTVLNLIYGVFISAALWWLGIPAPFLWGIIAAFMRFVPFIGSFIAAVGPFALAAAVDPGWTTLLITAGLFIISEVTMGQLIEPLVQGRSTGLSPMAVLIAAAFWTFLWGPAGLLLAIPMTLCLVVLGQHIDSLKFLHVLLGDEPALTIKERFYQRTLAGDAAEITDLAEQRIKGEPLSVYYEDVAIEGLRLAQSDADRCLIAEEHLAVIEETVETMVDNLWDIPDHVPPKSAVSTGEDSSRKANGNAEDEDMVSQRVGAADLPVLTPEDLSEAWRSEGAVQCVPAHSLVDQAAAHVISHLVTRHGIDAAVTNRSDVGRVSEDGSVDWSKVPLVCLCSLSEHLAATRYLARRIRRRLRDAHIVVILLNADEEKAEGFAATSQDLRLDVVQTLRETVDTIIGKAMSDGEPTSTIDKTGSSQDVCERNAAAVT